MESNSTAFLIKIKLRYSLGRPSRSDFVQSELCAQTSSPAIRTQADGYPGIPIIGRQELNEYRKKIVKKNKQAAKNVLGLYYNKKEHIVQKNDN